MALKHKRWDMDATLPAGYFTISVSIQPTIVDLLKMLGKSKKNLLPNNSGALMLTYHALYISVNKNFTNNQQMQPPLLVPRKKTHPGPA